MLLEIAGLASTYWGSSNEYQHHVLLFRKSEIKSHKHYKTYHSWSFADDDDEFRFNDASTHEGHLRQNGELTWFCSETIIMIRHRSFADLNLKYTPIKWLFYCKSLQHFWKI